MARIGKRVKKSTRALIEELSPLTKRAWDRSVREMTDNVNFAALRRAVEAKDPEAALEAMNIDEAFDALEKALLRSFEAGGKMTMKIISQEAAKHGQEA